VSLLKLNNCATKKFYLLLHHSFDWSFELMFFMEASGHLAF
jgi:hypothetical protein